MGDLNDFVIENGCLMKYNGNGGDVIIPKGVTKIYSNAFRNCKLITSVEIPKGVTEIDYNAFHNCTLLTKIVIPNSVIKIWPDAIYKCNSLVCNVKDNLRYLGNNENPYLYLVGAENIIITTANIDSNCRFIGQNAFKNCIMITSVTIPENITEIGQGAFDGCRSLTNIVISNNVKRIGYLAFRGCRSLSKVNYLGTIDDWAQIEFNSAYSNPIDFTKSLYINDVLVTNANITKATKIESGAFSDCEALTNVVIGNSVKSIGCAAFSYCRSLTTVTIANGVSEIVGQAFQGCTNLKSIVIPDSVIDLNAGVFIGCGPLTHVYYEGTAEKWSSITYHHDLHNTEAIVYFYSETKPTETGNYWHYINGVPTIWDDTDN